MESIKKIGKFFGQCAYVLGSIGGFGYAMYNHAYPIAAGVVVLACMAFPVARKWFRDIING